jgi:uncharacterized membrane protein YqaE (UPF0057 family)
MRKISAIAVLAVMGIILGSCGHSNNVVSNKLISKRKYTKGFHFNQKGHFKSGQDVQEEQALMAASGDQEAYIIASDLKTRPAVRIERNAPSEIIGMQMERSSNAAQSLNAIRIAENSKGQERIGNWKKEDLKKAVLKKEAKKQSAPNDDTVMLILLVILAIIIPPLAVFIYEGATNRFWIDLILAILGWGIGFWLLGGLGFLAGLAAIIYALLIVLEVI